ncbi:MAG: hypothetical protein WC240_02240 [Bacilli bacterium]
MEFVILTILVILLSLTIYYIYAALLNRRLNRKKKYLGGNETKNVYISKLKIFSSSTTMMMLFFVLFITIPGPLKVVNRFSSEENYQQIMNKMLYESEEQSSLKFAREVIDKIEIEENNIILETTNHIYAFDDNKLMVVALNESKKYLEYEYPSTNNLKVNIITTLEKIIVYRIFYEGQTLKSEVCIHKQEDLSLCEKITMKGAIEKLLVHDGYLKLFIKQEISTLTYQDSFMLLNYAVSNKMEMTQLNNAYYFNGGLIKKTLTIVRINLQTYKTKMQTIYLADYFLKVNEDVAYIMANMPSRNTLFPKSIILSYDLKKMAIGAEKVFGGSVYEKLSINENNELLLNVVRETEEKNQYITLVLNDELEVINSNIVELDKEVYLGTGENYYYTAIETNEKISFGTLSDSTSEMPLVSLENSSLQIGKLIKGKLVQVIASNNILYLLNYADEFAVQSKEIFICDNQITSLKIANYYVGDNHLRIVYEASNKIGYIKISLIDNQVEKAYEIIKTNEKLIFTDNYIIVVQAKSIKVLNSNGDTIFTTYR